MIDYWYWLGPVAVGMCLARPRVLDTIDLVLRGRLAVALERERRRTLIGALGRLRPGTWIAEGEEGGHRRFVCRTADPVRGPGALW